jgi:hypothetical protein
MTPSMMVFSHSSNVGSAVRVPFLMVVSWTIVAIGTV